MYSWYDIIQRMKGLIEENIEEVPRLSDIAKKIGYSSFYLTKKFHEIEGISYREYVLIRRIQHAALNLYTTRDRVIDVAIKYGYSSQEAFTRAFVRVYKVSPSRYRKMQKPTAHSEKSDLLTINGLTEIMNTEGGKEMKLYVKQMYDWNCYAYYAEDVDKKYWEYFENELWWKLGNSFIKQYDGVKDFKYCAANFTKYGELAIKQRLKILPTPWEKALSLFIAEMKKLNIDWYVHGSTAMALWGLDVAPKDVNIIIANYSDFDKVRSHFYKFAIRPIERCENWMMSGLGDIFMKAVICLAFHNKELEPYDTSNLCQITYNGDEIYISSLEMLKKDNENFNRPDRISMIEKKIDDLS